MLLGFKQQFVKPLLEGTKIHTIRTDRLNRWETARVAHCATGVRTKNYKQFALKKVTGIQDIFMTSRYGVLEISIDDKYLFGISVLNELAINDGFANYEEFSKWFLPLCEENENGIYSGRIIHFTNFRY